MKHFTKNLLLAVTFFGLTTTKVAGQIITVDEHGGGVYETNVTLGSYLLPFTHTTDPTDGLLNWDVLIYTLPFAGIAGDVLIQNPLASGSPIHDVLRFDGDFRLIFYSDWADGDPSLADTPGPPDPFSLNLFFVDEQGSQYFRFADYQPLPGEPGWDASNPNYRFICVGVIPEPNVSALLVCGLVVAGLWRRRRSFGFTQRATSTPLLGNKTLIGVCLLAGVLSSIAGETKPEETELPIGKTGPAFTLKDQNDKEVSLEGLLKKGPLVLVFYRSADWCLYCKTQLGQLQRNLKKIEAAGGQVVGISYDSPEILKKFSDRKKITFSLLSDTASKTIGAYGMRAKDATGQWAGIARHGVVILDQKGVIRAKIPVLSNEDKPAVEALVKALKEAQSPKGDNPV